MMMSTVCTHVYVYVCDYAPEYEYLDAYVTGRGGRHVCVPVSVPVSTCDGVGGYGMMCDGVCDGRA